MSLLRNFEAHTLKHLAEPTRWRGRIAVWTAVGLAPWGLLFAVGFAAIGMHWVGLSLLFSAIGVATGPWVLTRLGLQVAGLWMATTLSQSLVLTAVYAHGTMSPSLGWLVLCVALVFLLSGPRTGAVWTVVVVGVVTALGAAEYAGFVPFGTMPEMASILLTTASNIGWFFVSL